MDCKKVDVHRYNFRPKEFGETMTVKFITVQEIIQSVIGAVFGTATTV